MNPRNRIRRRRPVAWAAVATMAAATMAIGPAVAAVPDPSSSATRIASPAGDPAASSARESFALKGVSPGTHVVTLITGDRLKLIGSAGRFTVSVDRMAPRPPGERDPVINVDAGPEAVYAIPSDAQQAVDAGRLDRTLFDLKYLAENGYTDHDDKQLPLIVQYPDSRGANSVKSAAQDLPASTPTHELPSIHGAALSVPKAAADTFWTAVRGAPSAVAEDGAHAAARDSAASLGRGLAKVWLDGKVKATLNVSVPLIGAPQAWAAGHDGSGVKVAVLDTGIDATHPDFAGKIAASKSFVPGNDNPDDDHGHGTHVASTVAGLGVAADPPRKGVAPGAQLVVGKVLNNGGSGDASWIIDGMEWATTQGAKIVSMSLGGGPTDGTDPLSQAVNDLTRQTGTLFVIAGGNAGPNQETIAAPGAATEALTVAATDNSDGLTGFSSRGPRADGALKPDIAAPGLAITAARAAHGHSGLPDGQFYSTMSGTSMATPHIAGAAAILAQQHPGWTPQQLKAALMSTAKDDGFTVYEQGAGRVDVARADHQQVFAGTPNVDFGKLDPGTQRDPVSKQITYTNGGDAPVTLTLTRSLRRIGGDPVPDGAFTGDDTVTVPAGGSTTTTVTLDLNPLEVGRYTGAVKATDSAGDEVTVPVGLARDVPKVTLTIRILDHEGNTSPNASLVTLAGVDVPSVAKVPFTEIGDGLFRANVSPGTYSALGHVVWTDPETAENSDAYMIDPEIEVSQNTDITLDARTAHEVTMRTPRPTATYAQVMATSRSQWDGAIRTTISLFSYGSAQRHLLVSPTKQVSKGVFRFSVSRMLANPQIGMKVPGKDGFDLRLFHRGYADRGRTVRAMGDLDGYVPWPATHGRVRLVDVGFARPEDLTGRDLKGKLAVMQWGDDRFGAGFSGPPDGVPDSVIWTDRVHALKEAGATGYIAVSNPPAGFERNAGFSVPTTFVLPGPEGSPPHVELPEVQVSRDQGKELIQRLHKGALSLDVNVDPDIHYVEQIYPVAKQQIPESQDYVIRAGQEAEVDTAFHSDKPVMVEVGGGVFAAPGQNFSGSDTISSVGPARRTEYFGPLDPTVFLLRSRNNDGDPESWQSDSVFGAPGKSSERNFAPITAPGSVKLGPVSDLMNPDFKIAAAECTMCREGNLLWPVMFPKAYGEGKTIQNTFIVGGVRLFRENGEEIPVSTSLGVPVFSLPAEAANYRMTWVDQDDPGKSAEWTFRSAAPTADNFTNGAPCPGRLNSDSTEKCAQQPFVFLGYDLGSALGLDNTVRAGGRHEFTVFAYHPESPDSLPDIAGLKLWTSTDDGDTWKPAAVKRDSAGHFTITATYPKLSDTTGTVSIKAEGWDADGNSIKEVIKHAFRLSDSKTENEQ